MATSPFMGRV